VKFTGNRVTKYILSLDDTCKVIGLFLEDVGVKLGWKSGWVLYIEDRRLACRMASKGMLVDCGKVQVRGS